MLSRLEHEKGFITSEPGLSSLDMSAWALVISNHDPSAPGNSGDFDFYSSNSLLIPPHCGDNQLVKLCSFLPKSIMFYIALPSLPRYIIESPTFPLHYVDNAKVKTWHLPCYPPPCTGTGGPWCITKSDVTGPVKQKNQRKIVIIFLSISLNMSQ